MAAATSASRQAALRDRRHWPSDLLEAERQLLALLDDKEHDPLLVLDLFASEWPKERRDYAWAEEVAA